MTKHSSKLLSAGMAFLVLGACAGAAVARPDASPAAATAAASAADIETALREDDYFAVRSMAADAHRPRAERDLANAAVAYWLHENERAGDGLSRAANDQTLPANLRLRASLMLSGLRLQQGLYSEAAALITAALPSITDEADRTDLQQSLSVATPLSNVTPMQATVSGPGTITLTRDATSHMRAPVIINGGTLDAIVDIGSGISSISVSNARRLGLHQLAGNAVIGTATSSTLTTGLAIADDLSFGGARFRNVVFIVVPDEQFTFANGAYVVQGIIGLPLLMEMGRLEFENHGATETLRYGRTNASPSAASNLTVDSVQLYTYAQVDGAEGQARFIIDNGAPTSQLSPRFIAAFPSVAASARHEAVTVQGGAGSETQANGLVLPTLNLHFASTPVTLHEMRVFDDHKTERLGNIGLDVLQSHGGYVLDFDAMRFELLPSP